MLAKISHYTVPSFDELEGGREGGGVLRDGRGCVLVGCQSLLLVREVRGR